MLDDACMTLTCKVLTQQQSINSVLRPALTSDVRSCLPGCHSQEVYLSVGVCKDGMKQPAAV